MSMFQRRHYERLAEWAKDQPQSVTRSLARMLLSENPNFNFERFMRAADPEPAPKPRRKAELRHA